MKISKKEFVDAMTGNQTYFAGVLRKLLSKDEVYCAMTDIFKNNLLLEKRSCKARSKDLVFSGDSHLDLTGRKFYKYEYPEGVVYVAHLENSDDFGTYVNSCYYCVFN